MHEGDAVVLFIVYESAEKIEAVWVNENRLLLQIRGRPATAPKLLSRS